MIDIYVSNLNVRCMKCLCAASTGCPVEPLGCASGYCGPFQISKQYWLDAVKGTPLDTNDDAGIYVSNLNSACYQCLCVAASNCDLEAGCDTGFCGPYKISKSYYIDATKDTPLEGKQDFETCTNNLKCAKELVTNYMARYGQDCNDDGVTDCLDFGMISYNGGPDCRHSLNKTDYSLAYGNRLIGCTGHASL
ncbi:destabilase-related [Holotrichia oblita]|uniref:Destabilase-related n=1 Tax=Holotrichia oblita TaxID=644536 RepID=A0ACB9TRY1_HOLOL|nr:destabilase-related [Holotrichia oblita]